jgi:hypothetical protein
MPRAHRVTDCSIDTLKNLGEKITPWGATTTPHGVPSAKLPFLGYFAQVDTQKKKATFQRHFCDFLGKMRKFVVDFAQKMRILKNKGD